MAEPARSQASGLECLADNLQKPIVDDRSYRVIKLPNQLEALLIHDPETDKASAAMDVNVGSFSDDEEMPGMAHAVEHLLFMGTSKVSLQYPACTAYGHPDDYSRSIPERTNTTPTLPNSADTRMLSPLLHPRITISSFRQPPHRIALLRRTQAKQHCPSRRAKHHCTAR